jgi:fermentation-respiration switch protein FrsA (DUF1100 family)
VALAFDPSYTGESGEPRNVSSPEINTEDFSAAVDYLGLLPEVDREKDRPDRHLRLWRHEPECRRRGQAHQGRGHHLHVRHVAGDGQGLGDTLSVKDRSKILDLLSRQRWQDAQNGYPAAGSHGIYIAADGKVVMPARLLPETLPDNPHPVVKEFFDYYRTPRGFHKNSVNSSGAFTATSALSFMNMPLLSYIKEISPRPIPLIAGENAHSAISAKISIRRPPNQRSC